jgi:hypothetical protein
LCVGLQGSRKGEERDASDLAGDPVHQMQAFSHIQAVETLTVCGSDTCGSDGQSFRLKCRNYGDKMARLDPEPG